MMTGLHTRALIASPFQCEPPSGAPENREKAAPGEVMRDPYEWKSAVVLASALFVASLALAPAPGMDHKKFAAEINTKTLRAASAVTVSPRRPLRVRH
jgi:hypothetical protein